MYIGNFQASAFVQDVPIIISKKAIFSDRYTISLLGVTASIRKSSFIFTLKGRIEVQGAIVLVHSVSTISSLCLIPPLGILFLKCLLRFLPLYFILHFNEH
jgi:hypothetical protein